MSNARKLQTEIDRVMKKVEEGVESFDDIWEKVYSAEQQSQKEKHEMDLKKEIKKLQRNRDQIKSWIGSSDVKDKDALIEARKLIETKMEQFKICEKETKTKTYSKEGLARADRLSPEEEAKLKTTSWISEAIERLHQLVEERDVEIERLGAGKGKKSNKSLIEQYQQYNANHKFHISKLEGIMRLVNNDLLSAELVDEIKEELDYYMDAYDDEDYIQAYDEDMFYENLGLDELDVVNVDTVTQPTKNTNSGTSGGTNNDDSSTEDNRSSSNRSGGTASKASSTKKSNASSLTNVIPLTIGRARVTTTTAVTTTTTTAEKPINAGNAAATSNVAAVSNTTTTSTPSSATPATTPVKRIPATSAANTSIGITSVLSDSNSVGSASASGVPRRDGTSTPSTGIVPSLVPVTTTTTSSIKPINSPISAAAAGSATSTFPATTPTAILTPTTATGTSTTSNTTTMAAILKRDGEAQLEKERQQKALAAAALQAEQLRQQQQQQQQLLREQQQQQQQQQLAARAQQEQLRQQQRQQQQQQEAALRQQQEAMKRQLQEQQQQQQQQQQRQQQQEIAVKQQQLRQNQQQQQDAANKQLKKQQEQQQSGLDILSQGLGVLSLGEVHSMDNVTNNGGVTTSHAINHATNNPDPQSRGLLPTSTPAADALSSSSATSTYLGALNDSMMYLPTSMETERPRQPYTPRNPYPTPASYPTVPTPILDNPAIFEKLGTDCLFFIFYYCQGTYQQYLAARELKKQSWRFHKKYMTWFQRHEEPKVTTEEYEQGTYVYFDYETGWCQRLKHDFRFEYSFLEDSLLI
jgi:CCR4-NOT transcription complex subunit 3